ncbi:unnamed protein product [Leptidea sinapis]|uniref:Lipid-binding serum glycoprotein N-terminal domain-containing protein n=1 Tax=Leptidea sinapis TaxID=189913 RepID=A0A5E4QHG4_9NEOP|nr:unnamed protein product [Leptidea sinapis]
MKIFFFACMLLVASASALPKQSVEVEVLEDNAIDAQAREARLVSNTIRRIIENLKREIRDAGLDPLFIERFDYEYNVPFVVNIKVFVDNLSFSGISNIVIRTMDYNLILNRLRFDLSMPRISLSVENAGITARALFQDHKASGNGFLNINEIRVVGEVRVNIGIISGITIRSIDIQFSLGGINADINVVVLGQDYSDIVNEVEINEAIADLIKFIVDWVL